MPEAHWTIEDDATRRQILFVQPPTLEGAPIEHVYVGASHNGNVLRLFSSDYPQGHGASNLPFRSKTTNIASYLPVTQIDIKKGKNRGIGGPSNHWSRFRRVNKLCSSGISEDANVKNDGVIREMLQPLKELGHCEVREILEVELRFVAAQALPEQCFISPVIGGRASDHKNVLCARLEPQGGLQRQRGLQRLHRLRLLPYASKIGVQLGTAHRVLRAGTENDWDISEECFV